MSAIDWFVIVYITPMILFGVVTYKREREAPRKERAQRALIAGLTWYLQIGRAEEVE